MEEFWHDYYINYLDSLHSHSTWLIDWIMHWISLLLSFLFWGYTVLGLSLVTVIIVGFPECQTDIRSDYI